MRYITGLGALRSGWHLVTSSLARNKEIKAGEGPNSPLQSKSHSQDGN